MSDQLLTFGDVLDVCKKGVKIARQGWNGKGMCLVYVGENAWSFDTDANLDQLDRSHGYPMLPMLVMKTADNKWVPWLASQTDILAEDWLMLD